MSAQFPKKGLVSRLITGVVLVSFILTNAPIRLAYANNDKLRAPETNHNPKRKTEIKEKLENPAKLEGFVKFERVKDTEGGAALGLKEQNHAYSVLGDHKSIKTVVEYLPFGNYGKDTIDLEKSPLAKEKIEKIFGAAAQPGEEYAVLNFHDMPIALVKKDTKGELSIKKLFDELEKMPLDVLLEGEEFKDAQAQGVKNVDILLADYLFFMQRAKLGVTERFTLDWRELRDYYKGWKDKLPGYEKDPLELVGGKGRSLSLMDEVTDQPAGFNLTTKAYFKFVRENRAVRNAINALRDLNCIDDEARDTISAAIRDAIEKQSEIPADVSREIRVMYRHLNIINFFAGKRTPADVAVRSSATKEDLDIPTKIVKLAGGSQAGMADTFLGVVGINNVLTKTVACWASLFTDRAVLYRDGAMFLMLTNKMGYQDKAAEVVYAEIVEKIYEYADKLNDSDLKIVAEDLDSRAINPGTVNIMNALEEIIKHEKNEMLEHCLVEFRKVADEFVDPEQIGMDVVIMQMVNAGGTGSSGVGFTVNPANKVAGVPQALFRAWFMGDRSLVYEDEQGNIIGTKPILASFENAYGLGENIVGGKVGPDKVVQVTFDGVHWFPIFKQKGSKLIQMLTVEEAIRILKRDRMDEPIIQKLSHDIRQAISYDEAGSRISGVLSTYLYGTLYLNKIKEKEAEKEKKETEKEKKERLQKIATEIADKIKETGSLKDVKTIIKQNFVFADTSGRNGIKESAVDKVIDESFASIRAAKVDSERGINSLSQFFGNREMGEEFVLMLKENWQDQDFNLKHRQAILDKFGLKADEMSNISYLFRALVNELYTCNMETTDLHRNSFVLDNEAAIHIAEMIWDIATYYKGRMDVEFAIEIDLSKEGKKLEARALDAQGNVLGMKEGKAVILGKEEDLAKNGFVYMRLKHVQARPFTTDYLKVDIDRARSEVDEEFIDKKGIKPLAKGTQGVGATHGYVLMHRADKGNYWHIETIKRLNRGDFTPEEREGVVKLGFNPDDYGPGKKVKFPVIVYFFDADPKHDPILRICSAAIVHEGGETSHAAIFGRENNIPMIAGAGRIYVDGADLQTGMGLTADAKNGYIYKLEVGDKRIPIVFTKTLIKPYGFPDVDDPKIDLDAKGKVFPRVSRVIASESGANEDAALQLSKDWFDGHALIRTEEKGLEKGINIFAGYGYDLIKDIEAGNKDMLKRVSIEDIVQSRAKGAEEFAGQINELIFQYFTNENKKDILTAFKQVFNKNYSLAEGIGLLEAYELMKIDSTTGKLAEMSLTDEQKSLFRFLHLLPKEDIEFLTYLYGVTQRRLNFDYDIVERLKSHPWVLDAIEDKLKEKGYTAFKEFASKEYLYFFNAMGFSVAPTQKAKVRDYDFGQDKLPDIGSDIFSWPGVNPLVGLRGSALVIEGFSGEDLGNQKLLSFLLEAVIDANENTHNLGWFNVFVRFLREFDTLEAILDKTLAKKGKLPKYIGIMIEIPSDALLAKQLAERLARLKIKYQKYGVELTFMSFGTNDAAHTLGKGSRDDLRLRLKILDPAAIEAIAEMKREGYYYNDKDQELPLVDESSDVLLLYIESVVKEMTELGVTKDLCGEAVTTLLKRKDYVSAGRIMNLLDSFGISQIGVIPSGIMSAYDIKSMAKEITLPESERKTLFDFSAAEEINQAAGVMKGEIIFIDEAQDLLPLELRNLGGSVAIRKRRGFLSMQNPESAKSTVRIHNKIVVLSKNLIALSKDDFIKGIGFERFDEFRKEGLLRNIGDNLYAWTNLGIAAEQFSEDLKQKGYNERASKAALMLWKKAWDNTIEGLEDQGIDWGDLQHAKAIIIDGAVDLNGWHVFRADKSIIPMRVKIKVDGIGKLREQLEGKFVTLDFASKKIYEGNLPVKKKEAKIRSLPIPDHDPQVDTIQAVAEDANTVYPEFEYHPLLVLSLAKEERGGEKLEGYIGKIFEDYMSKSVAEIENISDEKRSDKKKDMLIKFKEKIEREPEKIIKEFLEGLIAKVENNEKIALPEDWLRNIETKYLAMHAGNLGSLKRGISELLKGKSAKDFIKDAFKRQMLKAIQDNPGKLVVHKTTSLNSNTLRNMQGGFLLEQIQYNSDYSLLGAARAIADFSEVNRLELGAWKEVWDSLPTEERKNFGLQITELKGTQSGAVLIGWKYVLKDMGIIPGEDGLVIGINIATPTDTLELDRYFKHFQNFGTGLSFVSFNKIMLGAAWGAVDIYWSEWRRLAREEELQAFGDLAVKIVKGKIEERNKSDENKKIVFDFGDQDKLPATQDIDGLKMVEQIDAIFRNLEATEKAVGSAG